MVKAYTHTMRRYAAFGGRTDRSVFWLFVLVQIAILLAVLQLTLMVHNVFAVLLAVYVVVTLVPTLAAVARRLHDIEKGTGWLLLGVGLASLALVIAFAHFVFGDMALGIALYDEGRIDEIPDGSIKETIRDTFLRAGFMSFGIGAVLGGIGGTLAIRLVALLGQPGDLGKNKYGPAPKPVS